jgi:hypothetical protein
MLPSPTVNNLLQRETYQLVDTIIGQIEHLPHGYQWWYGLLPSKGHNNTSAIRKRWVNLILATLFPPSFLTMLLSASILPSGKPNGMLYMWVLTHLYANNVEHMYAEWFAIKEGK